MQSMQSTKLQKKYHPIRYGFVIDVCVNVYCLFQKNGPFVYNNTNTSATGGNAPIVREQRDVLNDYLESFENLNYTVTNLSGYGSNYTDDEDMTLEITGNLSDGTVFVHRIPTIPIARKRPGKTTNVNLDAIGGGGESPQVDVTDEYFLDYLRRSPWHPRLVATAFFAMSTVISFLRMLPYVVVSDVVGPLQISLGTMITETAHFFLVVGVVVFSFSVGLTYIYSYYELAKLKQCQHILSGEEDQVCPKGTLPK